MCFILKLGRYITVPILTEWLIGKELLALDTSLVCHKARSVYYSLTEEYFHLCLTTFLKSSHFRLIELYGWSQKYRIPSLAGCTIHINRHDLEKILQYKWKICSVCGLQGLSLVVDAMNSDAEISLPLASFDGVTSLVFEYNCSNVVMHRLSNHRHLTSLSVNIWYTEISETVQHICRTCPLLTSLTITGYCYESLMLTIALECTLLKTFKCDFDNMLHRCALIFVLHGRCPLIEWGRDDIDNNDLLTRSLLWYKGATLTNIHIADSVLKLLPEACPHLQSLGLQFNNTYLMNAEILSISSPSYQNIDELIFDFSVEHTVIATILSHCSKLRCLELHHMSLTDDELLSIIKCCDHIKVLSILECHEMTDNYFDIILIHCSQLTQLSLHKCPALYKNSVPTIQKYCQHLVEFCVFECDTIDDQLCFALLAIPSLLRFYIYVTKLIVCADSVNWNVDSNVSALTLANMDYFPNSMLLSMVSKCSNLTSLNISFNNCLTLAGFEAIGEYCKNLYSLDIEWCEFDDSIIDIICRYCKRLQHLSTTGNNISKDKVKAIFDWRY